MKDILDKLDEMDHVPSKRTSSEYFSMDIDDLMEKFAYMNEEERDRVINRLDKITIDKIKILQEGGIL